MTLWAVPLAVALLAGGAAADVPAPASPARPLVDDRQRPIVEPLTARRLQEAEEGARSIEVSGSLSLPPDWGGLVEIEGESHGPVRVQAVDLRLQSGALVVPRKAVLKVVRPEGPALALKYARIAYGALSLAVETTLRGDGLLRVPAGSGLLHASDEKNGRFARLLNLEPGATVTVTPVLSGSAIALLRVVKSTDGAPIAGAVVKEYVPGEEEEQARKGRTLWKADESGLCLLSAEAAYLPTRIEADGFVPVSSHFAMERGVPDRIEAVKLSAGARPTFRISLDGEPGAGRTVRLREKGLGGTGRFVRYWKTGRTDEEGRWRPGVVAPGTWIVTVQVESAQPEFQQVVELVPDSADVVELQLERIRITGAVTRGRKGVPGVTIVIGAQDLGEKVASVNLVPEGEKVSTDEDGEFEAFVWREGIYRVNAGELARRTVSVPKTGAHVQIQLAEGDLVCRVVDAEGRPLPGATVTHKASEKRQSTTSTMRTDDNGSVSFSVQSGTTSTLHADAAGFRRSEKVSVLIPEEGAPPPVEIRLDRDQVLTGRFVGSMGMPIAGARIAAITETGGFMRASEATDADGRFEVSRSGERSFRLVLVSPRAPLTIHDVYDVGQEEELVLAPAESGLLEVQFVDQQGMPVPSRSAVLQLGGTVIQPALLMQHLAFRGLPPYSDARGSLVIPDLTPGEYSVLLPDVAAASGPGPLRVGVSVAPGRNSVRLTLEQKTGGS